MEDIRNSGEPLGNDLQHFYYMANKMCSINLQKLKAHQRLPELGRGGPEGAHGAGKGAAQWVKGLPFDESVL